MVRDCLRRPPHPSDPDHLGLSVLLCLATLSLLGLQVSRKGLEPLYLPSVRETLQAPFQWGPVPQTALDVLGAQRAQGGQCRLSAQVIPDFPSDPANPLVLGTQGAHPHHLILEIQVGLQIQSPPSVQSHH